MKFKLTLTDGCFDYEDLQYVTKLKKFGFTFIETVWDDDEGCISYINDNTPIAEIENIGQVIALINSLGRVIIDYHEGMEYPTIEIYNGYRE